MTKTRLVVERGDGRHRVWHTPGLLRAQRLHAPADVCRIGLVATTALLLGGDQVEVEVDVGPGARLELSEVAGTVAYPGRGRSARWSVRITLAEDAELTYRGEPFVVADGADVVRDTWLDLGHGARAAVRDTLVLGRDGETSGAIRNRTTVRSGGREVLVEDQHLDPVEALLPGLLGEARVLDSLLLIGLDPPALLGPASQFALSEGAGTVIRFLGRSLACSPIPDPRHSAVMLGR